MTPTKEIIDLDEDEARVELKELKKKFKSFRNINLGSIEEYERINKRYEFLNNGKNDLLDSEKNLLGIIDEMDETMEEKFITTFKKVNNEFNSVFKKLFNGGEAHLELTNPDNYLETGIDITAKKITMSSDNVDFVSSSGNKVWLNGKDSSGNEIFRLGRNGNSSPYLRFAESENSTTKYATYSMDSIYLNHAYNDSIAIAANGAETLASFTKGTRNLEVGINNSNNPFVKLTNGSYEVVIYIDSSGKLRIKPSSKSMWISNSNRTSTSSGEVYVDDDGFLKINNWS